MAYEVTDFWLRFGADKSRDTTNIDVAVYTNDVTPTAASVIGDFTLDENTTLSSTTDGNPTVSGAEGTQAYEYIAAVGGGNSGKTVYGFVIWRDLPGTDVLLWAHRFSTPISAPSNTTTNVEVRFKRMFRQV